MRGNAHNVLRINFFCILWIIRELTFLHCCFMIYESFYTHHLMYNWMIRYPCGTMYLFYPFFNIKIQRETIYSIHWMRLECRADQESFYVTMNKELR